MVQSNPFQHQRGYPLGDRIASDQPCYGEVRPEQVLASRPSTIDSALRNYCHVPVSDYALIVRKDNGEIETFASSSLKGVEHRLFTHSFRSSFQHYASSQEEHGSSISSQGALGGGYSDFESDGGPHKNLSSSAESCSESVSRVRGSGRLKIEHPNSAQLFGSQLGKRARSSINEDAVAPKLSARKRQVNIGDSDMISDFYLQRFKDLQQTACKIIGKAFVKFLAPKKQSNYPYTKGDSAAPPWWPSTKGSEPVRHKEPDHLTKPERLRLCVHILRLVMQPPRTRLEPKKLTISMLEDVTQEAMANWFGDPERPNNASKKPFLKELFAVAKQEERYLDGQIDSTLRVSIMHKDHRPNLDDSDDEDEDGSRTPLSGDSPTTEDLGQSSIIHAQPPASNIPQEFHFSGRDVPFRYHPLPVLSPTIEEQPTYGANPSLHLSSPSVYTLRQPETYQQPSPLGLQDSNRRSSWQDHQHGGYSNGVQSANPVFNSTWPQQNNMIPPGTLSYPYNSTTISAGGSTVPYLPIPTTIQTQQLPATLPPINQQHHNSFSEGVGSRIYDNAVSPLGRTTSIDNHHAELQQSAFHDYLNSSSSYVQGSENVKGEDIRGPGH